MDKDVDVVYLDENMLWRLKEKLEGKSGDKRNKMTRSLKTRPPKYQVYQPGVTRLSNKPALFKAKNSNQRTNVRNDAPEEVSNDNKTPSHSENFEQQRNNLTQNNHKKNTVRQDRRPKTNKNRNLNEKSHKTDVIVHDEMEWDNFGGDLIQGSSWSVNQNSEGESNSQISNSYKSEECTSCCSPLYHTPEHVKKEPRQMLKPMQRFPSGCSDKSLENLPRDRTSSYGGSESSWGADKAKQISENDFEWEGDDIFIKSNSYHGQNDQKYASYEDEIEQDEIENNCNEGRRLFDPSNPDKPIIVKYEQDERNTGDYYIPPTPEVYSRGPSHREYDGFQQNSRYNYENRDPVQDAMDDNRPARYRNNHKSFMSTLQVADKAEMALSNMLSNPSFDSDEFIDNLTRQRNKLKSLYESIILSDIDISTQNQIEQSLWKNVFYQVIEILRDHIRHCVEDRKPALKDYLCLLLDQARAFYESLLESLQRNHNFNLKDILHNPVVRKKFNTKGGKRIKLSLLSCQRTFIALGDIARYREQVKGTTNYGQSRHCYLQAQLLAPKNGRPYNQLALLGVKTRNKIDAVYYYMRSLCASNPILTARESLMVLFDEIRRKFDMTEKKKQEDLSRKLKSLSIDVDKKDLSGLHRKEIWILPGDDVPKQSKNVPSDPLIPQSNLPISDVMKHFMLIFLNIHGKQFTRVGLENYYSLLPRMLANFKLCIEKLSLQRLLQIFTLNMFAISNASLNSIHSNERETKLSIDRSVSLLFSMLTVVVDYSNTLLKMVKTSSATIEFGGKDDKNIIDKINIFHAVIKTVFDWLYCNKDLWCERELYRSTQVVDSNSTNLWEALCQLADWVCDDHKLFPVLSYTEQGMGLEEIFLPEDTYMSGFTYILQTFSESKFVDLPNEVKKCGSKTVVHICIRFEIIRDFLEYLCGMDKPILAFKEGKYVVLKYFRRHSSNSDHDPESFLLDYESTDEAVIDHDLSYENSKNVSEGTDPLKMYRDSLREKSKEMEARKDIIAKSLNESDSTIVTLQIKPKKLVPDTNCFIDHLDDIKLILEKKTYFISLPLVVIKELEGLGKAVKSSSDHDQDVFKKARKAVTYIKEMVSKNSFLCPLTSEGTEIHTLRFLSEEINAVGKNDDFILKSAECLEKKVDVANASQESGDKLVVRSVVLITEDRNLRLKALMHNMPSKSIKEFCKWAKIY